MRRRRMRSRGKAKGEQVHRNHASPQMATSAGIGMRKSLAFTRAFVIQLEEEHYLKEMDSANNIRLILA